MFQIIGAMNTFLAVVGKATLQAARAMAPIAGMAFVTVQHHHREAVLIGQGFVAFEPEINLTIGFPQSLGFQHCMHSPHRVGTGRRML